MYISDNAILEIVNIYNKASMSLSESYPKCIGIIYTNIWIKL